MIFPKQQMKIEQTYSEDLKKQALQLIISLYLNRKMDEDISFLKNNFVSTSQFATGIRSSLKNGLAFADVQTNRILYGQNQKFLPEMCLSLRQCFRKQFANLFIIVSFILLISSAVYGEIKNIKQLSMSSEIILCFYAFAAFIRVFCTYYYSYLLSKTSLQKTKTNKYQVIRNSRLLEIEESQIVVGDIVELGFKQKVPATGIMLSDQEIYVKENPQRQSIQTKTNLQSCVKKIQGMNILDFKLSIEQRTLPSPIILRGSQLLQGNTYPILIISVTEENLLKQFGYNVKDNFSNKDYNHWVSHLQKRWINWCIYLTFLIVVVLAFGHFADYKLLMKNSPYAGDLFFQFLLQIATLILISNVSYLSHFLNVIFMKLMIKIRVIQNFDQFFKVQRILINQRNVVDYDKIVVSQIAVCQKIDLIGPSQLQNLNILTNKLICQIKDVFGISFQQIRNSQKQKRKGSKIVHVNKKNKKIISMISSSEAENNIFQEVLKEITKINDQPFINSKVCDYKNSLKLKKQNGFDRQKTGSCNFLKIPKLDLIQRQQGQNLKQILHSRCRMKSKGLLDNLVSLAQKGMRTYYFQIFDLRNLEQVTHIVLNGQVTSIAPQLKERMVMLARKMNLIYNLTPIMIGYNEGPYNQKPLRILVCILGVIIPSDNIIINSLNQLKEINISSLIFLSSHSLNQDVQQEEKSIFQQYKLRGWLTNEDAQNIRNSKQIKKTLKRLVCKNCWISNCDCKQKIQQVSNIQPFISMSDRIKVVYQTDEESLKFIESAFRQLQNPLVCINSPNALAFDIIDSIFTCQRFIENLKRSVILFYALVIVYLIVPLLFWLRNIESIKPLQVGISFCLLSTLFGLGLLCSIKTSTSKTQPIQNKIKINTKQKTILIYTICLLMILVCHLYNFFSHKIPEFPDYYDTLIARYQLDSMVCKYGDSWSVTTLFQTSQCSVPEIGLQFSRISTFICTYLYLTLWALFIFTHRNFTHLGSLLCYIFSLLLYICLVEFAPQIIHSYSEGLTWQHYLILIISALVTLTGGFILSCIISRIPVTSYFDEQTQSKINFIGHHQNHYSCKLKHYHSEKKVWGLKSTKNGNVF